MSAPVERPRLSMMGKSALWYARKLGWRVIPVRPGDKAPPLIRRWQHEASSDEAQIVEWWTQWPEANIALLCGPESGVWALDVDPRHGGDVWLDGALAGRELPATPRSQTPAGGWHAFFAWPLDRIVPPKASVETGVDIRGRASYVVLPPSKRPDGDYVWRADARPGDLPFAAAPEWLFDLLLPKTPLPTGLAPREGAPAAAPVEEALTKGRRTPALTSLAGTLRRRGLGKDEILAALRPVNARRCDPPLPESALEHIASSMERYQPGAPIAGGDSLIAQAEANAPGGLTDEGKVELLAALERLRDHSDRSLAALFVELYGRDLRYCQAWRSWLVWTGRRWELDDSGRVFEFAKGIARRIYDVLPGLDGPRQSSLAKLAVQLGQAQRIKSLLGLAQSEPGIPVKPDELDSHPDLIGTPAGVVDLRDGSLSAHSRDLLLTAETAAQFLRDAECPTFTKFLNEIMAGRPELAGFVQRALGYALTGRTNEQVLFILHGGGANGKSTLLEAVRSTLGRDFTANADTATFMGGGGRGDGSAASPNLAALQGKRLATIFESGEGRRLDEELVKQVTGGDPITARRLYGAPFEFFPHFKLFLSCNHLPNIKGTDHAIWRRIKLIPFGVTFGEARQDKKLGEKLSAEAPGILSFLVAGAVAWYRDGLGSVPDVTEAVENYRQEMDVIGEFVRERCRVGEGEWEPAGLLYGAYRAWAQCRGERPLSQRAFGDRLTEQGFAAEHCREGKRRRGIALLGPNVEEES